MSPDLNLRSWPHEFESDRHHDRSISSACSFSTVFEKIQNMSLPRKIRHSTGFFSTTDQAFPTTESISALAHHGVVLETLDRDLRRFWKIKMPQKAPRSPRGTPVRRALQNHTSRISEGRYIVRLPLKTDYIYLSRSIYLDRWIALYCCFELGTMLNSRSNYCLRVSRISRRVRNTRTKSPPTEIVKQSKLIFRITLSYVTAVQPPAYEWSSTPHATSNETLNDYILTHWP